MILLLLSISITISTTTSITISTTTSIYITHSSDNDADDSFRSSTST